MFFKSCRVWTQSVSEQNGFFFDSMEAVDAFALGTTAADETIGQSERRQGAQIKRRNIGKNIELPLLSGVKPIFCCSPAVIPARC